jgi:hypothetical protein
MTDHETADAAQENRDVTHNVGCNKNIQQMVERCRVYREQMSAISKR